MKRYKAVMFDFDMTLADSSKVIVGLLNDCAEEFGFARKTFEQTLPVLGGTHEAMLSHVTGVRDPGKLLVMRERYRDLCRTRMAAQTCFFPDAEACVKEIAEKGILMGILSQKLREVLLETLRKDHLDHYFSVVLGCEDVPAPKPDPSGLVIAMKALCVHRREDLLYIGDSLIDQGTAVNAGVDFGAMLLGGTKKEQFDPGHVTHYFSSLEDLRKEIEKLAGISIPT